MPELTPEESEAMRNWNFATSKGRIAAFVARGKENPSTISKALKTLMAKGKLTEQDLNKMLLEVEKESVDAEAFHKDASYSRRKERLERLKEELCLRN